MWSSPLAANAAATVCKPQFEAFLKKISLSTSAMSVTLAFMCFGRFGLMSFMSTASSRQPCGNSVSITDQSNELLRVVIDHRISPSSSHGQNKPAMLSAFEGQRAAWMTWPYLLALNTCSPQALPLDHAFGESPDRDPRIRLPCSVLRDRNRNRDRDRDRDHDSAVSFA